MSRNDVTGDNIATRFGSAEQQKAFDLNFERIFGMAQKQPNPPPSEKRPPPPPAPPQKALTQEEFTEWLNVAVKEEHKPE